MGDLTLHTYAKIDWLAVSYKTVENPLKLIPQLILKSTFKDAGNPPRHYVQRLINELGAVVLRGGDEKQGTQVLLTGQVLNEYRNDGGTDRQLCIDAEMLHGKVNRLDVAIDIKESGLQLESLLKEIEAGNVKTRARGGKHIKHLYDSGEGIYVGSPTSNRLFRAYNKAAEQKVDEDWIRLELQLRRLHAQAVANTIAKENETRPVINAAIVTFIDFPSNQIYQAATSDRDATIPKVPRKMTSTYQWLMNTCAPALAKYELDHPDDDTLDAFLMAYAVAKETLTQTRT